MPAPGWKNESGFIPAARRAGNRDRLRPTGYQPQVPETDDLLSPFLVPAVARSLLPVTLYNNPRSAKETQSASPTTRWSSTRISTRESASRNRRVINSSA